MKVRNLTLRLGGHVEVTERYRLFETESPLLALFPATSADSLWNVEIPRDCTPSYESGMERLNDDEWEGLLIEVDGELVLHGLNPELGSDPPHCGATNLQARL